MGSITRKCSQLFNVCVDVEYSIVSLLWNIMGAVQQVFPAIMDFRGVHLFHMKTFYCIFIFKCLLLYRLSLSCTIKNAPPGYSHKSGTEHAISASIVCV